MRYPPIHALGLLLVAGLLSHCTPAAVDPATNPVEDAAERALLRNIAQDVVRPSIRTFATEATALHDAVTAWCPTIADDAGHEGDPAAAATAKQRAQAAWLRTATAWQRLQPMAVGPHAAPDMAEAIDSWPLVNPCAVDQGVQALLVTGAVDVAASLPNRKGLDALETLLFRVTLDSPCPPQAAPKGWADRTATARKAARCAYAEQVAAALLTRAENLRKSWKPGPNSYVEILAHAGEKGTVGGVWASSHAALNALSDAVMSREIQVKVRRLGAPLGLAANSCGTVATPCSKAVESPWAHRGATLLQANLAGARAVLLGAEPSGRGFDDWLVRKGAGAAATAMTTHLDATRDAFAALPTSLQDGLTQHPAELKRAYEAIGALTHQLKTQLLVALNLRVPAAVDGDGD